MEEVRARARENEPLYYTSPILQGHLFYINALHVTGTSTATEDFQEYLTQPEFDPFANVKISLNSQSFEQFLTYRNF